MLCSCVYYIFAAAVDAVGHVVLYIVRKQYHISSFTRITPSFRSSGCEPL